MLNLNEFTIIVIDDYFIYFFIEESPLFERVRLDAIIKNIETD